MNSNYNSGNVKLEHRGSQGALLAIYTWAKSLDMKSAAAGIGASGGGFAGVMDEADPKLNYGPADFDVGQRFVVSYVYELPFGRGRKLLPNSSRALDAAVGGWELTGIGTFQDGFPFSVVAADEHSLLTAFSQRANITGSATSGFHKSATQWFNKAAFSQPGAGVFGDSGRNILRQPGISNWDMGAVGNNVNSGTYGILQSMRPARVVQLGGKITF